METTTCHSSNKYMAVPSYFGWKTMRGKRILFLTILFSLMLTACQEKIDLYFQPKERWRADMDLTIDKAILDMLLEFGGSTLFEEFGLPSLPSAALESESWIEIGLNMFVSEWEKHGIEADWSQASNTYRIRLRGENHAQFTSAFYEAIHLSLVENNPETYLLTGTFGPPADELTTLALGFLEYDQIITIHAGRILECNGCEIQGGKAIWHNPQGEIRATFTPARPSLPWQILLLCIIAPLIIGAIVVIAKRSGGQPCPSCGHRVRKGQEICSNCGSYVDSFDMMY